MKSDSSSSSPNWPVVLGCMVLIVGWMIYSEHRWPTRPAPVAPIKATAHAGASAANLTANPGSASAGTLNGTAATSLHPTSGVSATPPTPEQQAVLENEELRALFTSDGGGIVTIELKKHAEAKGGDRVILNGSGLGGGMAPEPIFNLTGWEAEGLSSYDQKNENGRVTYTRNLSNGIRLERSYTLTGGYQLSLEQRLVNPTGQPIILPASRFHLASATPLYRSDRPTFVSVNWQANTNNSNSSTYGNIGATDFSAGGMFGLTWRAARDLISSPASSTVIRWVAVKNRFFTVVLTPASQSAITQVPAQPFNAPLIPIRGSAALPPSVDAAVLIAPITLAAGETRTDLYHLYAGPKDHDALEALGQGQDRLMEYGWWGWVSVPLLNVMEWMHRGISNYGWVIVLLTIALILIFWPLQSAANRSMKKMQALAPRQKEISAKYKEDPQRMQAEIMKLYKEYGVNPVGGCLPMLIQIPIFFGFYTMLQSAVQFRHQSWLWVHDLVQPDTVATIPGFNLPVNPLPIIMAITQYVVMKLTPQAGDNSQMKVLQWMPFVMLVLFYNFAAALALYWTVNNLITMIQTYRNLRKPVPILQRIKKSRQMKQVN